MENLPSVAQSSTVSKPPTAEPTAQAKKKKTGISRKLLKHKKKDTQSYASSSLSQNLSKMSMMSGA